MRDNRMPKSCPLSDKKDLQKKERGYFEHSISRTDGILVVKWDDNPIVTIATNRYGVSPVTNVRLYSRKEKEHIKVSRPALLAEYDKKMGGTDRLDQNNCQYRIQIKNREWYWPLSAWLLDVSINNAWCLYRKANSSQIFRRVIA
nr:unnamed protein product [Callosobruchus analis]